MGRLSYERTVVEFDDRVLAHLQIVIVQRFRAGNRLMLAWLDALEEGDGRSSIWLSPSMPMRFRFRSSTAEPIDRAWLDRLNAAAASPAGLVVCDRNGHLIRALHHHRLTR